MGNSRGKKMNNNNKLTVVNEMLFQELERLNDDKYILDDKFDQKLKRSAALQKAAISLVKVTETNIKVLDEADRNATTVERMNDFLGLKDTSKKKEEK